MSSTEGKTPEVNKNEVESSNKPNEEVEEKKQDLPTYPLNPNLRVALKEYLGQRSYNEVSELVAGLDMEQVPGQVIIDISNMLQQERPVRLMQGLQLNIQNVNKARQQQQNTQPIQQQKSQHGTAESSD